MNTLDRQRARPVFHLVANSHIDPVWLWNWQEGLNEALSTVNTVLALMREHRDLTYIRGETLIYEEVLRHAPAMFGEIKRLVREGRWDPVGGTYLQPDMNLPAAETLHRHFNVGQAFFQEYFQRRAWAGWSADCFGHTPFLPDILRTHGLRAYAFGRPNPPDGPKLFWWESPNRKRVLAATYVTGWYGCERDELTARLDAYLESTPSLPVRHVFIPFGLGNHGGGPTRRHLDDIATWQARHSEVDVRYSTLHGYFTAVEREVEACAVRLPVVRGDLGYCMRGTYSTGLALKSAYRRAESGVIRAASLLELLPAGPDLPAAKDLDALWREVLFNSFHDILPATATAGALSEQMEQLGGVLHGCRVIERHALLAIAQTLRVDMPAVPADHPNAIPFLVVNPLAHPYCGLIELEACLDHRPLWRYANRGDTVPLELRGPARARLRFQVVRSGHNFMMHIPWRMRIVFEAVIPAKCWAVFTLGWVEEARIGCASIRKRMVQRGPVVRNAHLRVSARIGSAGVAVFHGDRPLLARPGLSAILVDDPYGPWGGHYEEKESLELLRIRERWNIVASRVVERGPIRMALWCRLAGARSQIDLTFTLEASTRHVTVNAAVFFNDVRARLKLVFPGGDVADFAVPGGVIRRGPQGEVPGGRWARILDQTGRPRFVFASDALYNFNTHDGCFYATVVRSSRYTMDVPEHAADLPPGEPVIDRGAFRFRFLIGRPEKRTMQRADFLEQAPLVAPIPMRPRDATQPTARR